MMRVCQRSREKGNYTLSRGEGAPTGAGEERRAVKDFLRLYIERICMISGRIPHPARLSSLHSGGPPSPREKVFLSLVNILHGIEHDFSGSKGAEKRMLWWNLMALSLEEKRMFLHAGQRKSQEKNSIIPKFFLMFLLTFSKFSV